jgi:hypothetical protein
MGGVTTSAKNLWFDSFQDIERDVFDLECAKLVILRQTLFCQIRKLTPVLLRITRIVTHYRGWCANSPWLEGAICSCLIHAKGGILLEYLFTGQVGHGTAPSFSFNINRDTGHVRHHRQLEKLEFEAIGIWIKKYSIAL